MSNDVKVTRAAVPKGNPWNKVVIDKEANANTQPEVIFKKEVKNTKYLF